jgi:hypothetical protein
MELLESSVVRPRQAHYQAALRPDTKCTIDSKALSNFTATPIRRFCLDRARTVPNTFTGTSLRQNPAAFRWLGGSSSPKLPVSSVVSFENTF